MYFEFLKKIRENIFHTPGFQGLKVVANRRRRTKRKTRRRRLLQPMR